MAPEKTGLLRLPLELFRAILVQVIRVRNLKRAFRLRLVNREYIYVPRYTPQISRHVIY